MGGWETEKKASRFTFWIFLHPLFFFFSSFLFFCFLAKQISEELLIYIKGTSSVAHKIGAAQQRLMLSNSEKDYFVFFFSPPPPSLSLSGNRERERERAKLSRLIRPHTQPLRTCVVPSRNRTNVAYLLIGQVYIVWGWNTYSRR